MHGVDDNEETGINKAKEEFEKAKEGWESFT